MTGNYDETVGRVGGRTWYSCRRFAGVLYSPTIGFALFFARLEEYDVFYNMYHQKVVGFIGKDSSTSSWRSDGSTNAGN